MALGEFFGALLHGFVGGLRDSGWFGQGWELRALVRVVTIGLIALAFAVQKPFTTVLAAVAVLGAWLMLRNHKPQRSAALGRDSRHIPRDMIGEVFRRSGGYCVECGATEQLQVDHIIPWSIGGATSPENLQVLCGPCNRRKSDNV